MHLQLEEILNSAIMDTMGISKNINEIVSTKLKIK